MHFRQRVLITPPGVVWEYRFSGGVQVNDTPYISAFGRVPRGVWDVLDDATPCGCAILFVYM